MAFNRETFFEFIKKKNESKTYVSPSTDYYLNAFDRHYPRRWFRCWNWSAFFFSDYWMMYRGMVGYAITMSLTGLLIGLFLLTFVLMAHASEKISPLLQTTFWVAYFLPILMRILLGLYGTALYFRFAEGKMARSRTPQSHSPSGWRVVIYTVSWALIGMILAAIAIRLLPAQYVSV